MATAARQASLTELVKSVARGEWHGTVLKAELGGAEAEAACLIDALRSAGELRELSERAAAEQREELQLQQRLAEKLRAELQAAESERDELAGKLAGSHAKNKAWEERVDMSMKGARESGCAAAPCDD